MIAECICVRSTGEIVTDGGRLSASGCAPHTQHGLFWNPILLAHAVRCLNQGTNSTFFFHDPTAPSWSWPPRYRGFTMTHTHAHTHTHSFGILWTSTFFFHDPTAPSWSWPPRYRGFTMTHTHAHTHALIWNSLDK